MVREVIPISEKTKIKYPKSIGFIISNEFCERFNYYGMRTILVLYLRMKLDYDDDTATVLFHIFTSFVYFFPLLGAILADSWLGKFKTIFYLSIVYCIGSVIISIGAIPTLNLPASVMTIIGLLLIALGTGGIKPCVSAFGGDQFKIPEQAKQLATFFSLFYFAINAGSLISTSLTPILREDVHCFGDMDCFSLAFGVPGILMIVSIIIFVFGKSLYVIKKPSGNMVVTVTKCIGNAITAKSKDNQKRDHWLDYAEPKYGKQIVNDVKALLKILVLYLPLPMFWALFDQQGSRWTFQATRMTGDLGFFTLKPDQMQVINPLLILVFIPLFDYLIYPMLAKVGIKRPLQKLTFGGILAGIAFLISGFVELKLETTYPVIPGPTEAQLRIFNGMPCPYEIITNIPNHEKFILNSLDSFEEKYLDIPTMKNFTYQLKATTTGNCANTDGTFILTPATATSYFIMGNSSKIELKNYIDSPQKSKNGFPNIRILANTKIPRNVEFRSNDDSIRKVFANLMKLETIAPGQYDIYVNDFPTSSVDLKLGGVYTFVLNEISDKEFKIRNHVISNPNSVHMLWLIPQYVVITAGEVMFSVTGLEFSFTQAPSSMKSVLQACWLLAVAFGNLIVVVIAEVRAFDSQAAEFFLFAGLMIFVMGIFIILAMRYKYVETSDEENSSITLEDSNTNTNDDKLNTGISNKGFTGDS